jgi:phosphonopyruvate decarboxylase
MIRPDFFIEQLMNYDISFFAGVPDSLLKNICAYITDHSDPKNNIIAANEGAAMGLAAGYHLATGKIPVVYMQNSGEGNMINPLLSLTDADVYNIPVLLIIGWRGEPGVKDEPQHIKQGKLTLDLLDTVGVKYDVLSGNEDEAAQQIGQAVSYMRQTGEAYALVVRKNTFDTYQLRHIEEYPLALGREEAIQMVAGALDEKTAVVSTTGMISRELFEYRANGQLGHQRDFLTVGSMGHASQIALGIALYKPTRKVCCFDGDGAMLMHMGSVAVIAGCQPKNYYHVVFNNGAHDSVGGQPTVGLKINLADVAKDMGYRQVWIVKSKHELQEALPEYLHADGPVLLEVQVKKGNRKDLGRPTKTPVENKESFMAFLKNRQ